MHSKKKCFEKAVVGHHLRAPRWCWKSLFYTAGTERASKIADFAKDTFSHVEGNIFENATAEVACDHFHRYKEDILLVKELGANAYRFSISWSRVLPTGSIEGASGDANNIQVWRVKRCCGLFSTLATWSQNHVGEVKFTLFIHSSWHFCRYFLLLRTAWNTCEEVSLRRVWPFTRPFARRFWLMVSRMHQGWYGLLLS